MVPLIAGSDFFLVTSFFLLSRGAIGDDSTATQQRLDGLVRKTVGCGQLSRLFSRHPYTHARVAFALEPCPLQRTEAGRAPRQGKRPGNSGKPATPRFAFRGMPSANGIPSRAVVCSASSLTTCEKFVPSDLCQFFGRGSLRNQATMESGSDSGFVRSKSDSMAFAGIWWLMAEYCRLR